MIRWQKVIKLAVTVALIPSIAIVAVVWDEWRVDRDYYDARKLLYRARAKAMDAHLGPITVRFTEHEAITEDQSGQAIESLSLPTLDEVRFRTVRGDRQVIFAAGGGQTNPFNVHLHGGDFTFKGWTGYSRSIWIHCTGGITSGRNDDWVLK